MTNKWMLLAAVAGLAIVGSGFAADALKIGSPAPKLQVGKWVQGEPVTQFEPGKVYVVEFWATWCGPCKVSIPHLNELYLKYKDKGVVVIGQDCWEQDESLVAPFVKKMGTNMTYRVALDDKSHSEKGAMADTWMDAAGRNGIPSAFIINKKGVVAWIGHPMEMTEKLWDEILSDKYDVAKASADFEKAEASQKQLQDFSMKLREAVANEKWDDADKIVDDMAKLNPENTISPAMMKVNLLLARKKYDEAYKKAGELSDAHPDEAGLQNALAWTLAAQPGLEKRDTVLAEKMAERANKATSGKEPAVLDTLARTQFMNGKKEAAIATEKKAVDLAEAGQAEAYKLNLKSYQNGKLPEP
jgi:thiol-disulfide isomerase/thioredoxin